MTASSPAPEPVRGDLALERWWPTLAGRLARFPLTALPTPTHRLQHVARTLGIGQLWVKRDDRSGRLYGGNKPRKLEFLLGAALARGRDSVLTFGALGSHHGLATAIGGREAGLHTILVLVPQPVTEHVRRCLLLDHAYGAELHYAPNVARAAAAAVRLTARAAWRGNPTAIIPTGGSSALGTIGYVNAALELAEQIRAGELPEPASIFVPLGSGGTLAGLTLGLKLARLRSRVVGVLVTDILPPSRARLVRLAQASLEHLRQIEPEIPRLVIDEGGFTLLTGHVGRCYGAPTEEAERAARLMEAEEGIRLETTYTAKCFAALLELARQPPYRDQTLLFWNTFSSIDPGAMNELPHFRELPRPFHRFFEVS